MTTSIEHEYVLGTHDDELRRLGLQHLLWGAEALDLWLRAGFRAGQTLLDVGCGPGFATLDLSTLVGTSGRVIAIDEASSFVEHLRTQIKLKQVVNVEVVRCDVQRMDMSSASADGAYARWVFCFLPDPVSAIRAVGKALKSGGVFAIQDYLNYADAISLSPKGDGLRKVIAAVAASWRSHGGDPNIVRRLPSMLQENGFEVREIRPIVRTAGPNHALWQWPGSFFKNFGPSLVATGFLSEEDRRCFEVQWREASQDPHAFFCTPIVADVIAVKK